MLDRESDPSYKSERVSYLFLFEIVVLVKGYYFRLDYSKLVVLVQGGLNDGWDQPRIELLQLMHIFQSEAIVQGFQELIAPIVNVLVMGEDCKALHWAGELFRSTDTDLIKQ